ncbi:zinc finger protein weckle [Drosophila novamexicana]|uniref:zinc finger protein weckle n=1 Tax=Drosophila novamexicana TaxID=47314 RepID=UPI0011E5CBE2|nr:zinc finger protein weckle [Drosophila novamexicana]
MTGCETVRSAAEESPTRTDASSWHRWCRLCAKDHPDNVNVYFRNGDQTWTSVLAVAIGKYFWVNIKMEDELSNALCKECYTLVEDLNEFSDRVSRVQTLFSRLQQAGSQVNLDYDELRKECGLQPDEWKHIVSKDATLEGAIEKSNADAVEYIVDEMVEAIDEAAELAEIDESPFVDHDEENAYESNAENEETTEPAYVEQDVTDKEYFEPESTTINTYVEQEAPSEDTEVVSEPNPNIDDAETDPQTAATPTNDEDIQKDVGATDELRKIPMAEHEDVDDGHNQYKCTSCSKGYKNQLAYKRHMAVFHGLVPTDKHNLECKRCHTFFATEIQLTAHYRTHLHAKDKTENSCSYCPKSFTTAGALKRHVSSIHENIKPYICDCCGKAMKTITALNEHKLVHTDECPFECPICFRSFKNKARLKIHSDTHTNNDYKCNVCGLKLNTRRTLNMHKLVHTDAKQYKCDVCGAAFKRGKTLKAHLILHTGIRPYKCNFCGKDFSNGSNCRMHKRKTHPKELAEEEARGVIRSTLLPMITELTEASKRVKKPAKAGTAVMRVRVTEETTDPTNDIISGDELEAAADDEVLYEIVEECT